MVTIEPSIKTKAWAFSLAFAAIMLFSASGIAEYSSGDSEKSTAQIIVGAAVHAISEILSVTESEISNEPETSTIYQSSEQEKDNTNLTIQSLTVTAVWIQPASPNTSQDLFCNYTTSGTPGFDSFVFKWYKNNVLTAVPGGGFPPPPQNIMPSSETDGGENWTCKFEINGVGLMSDPVTITGNATGGEENVTYNPTNISFSKFKVNDGITYIGDEVRFAFISNLYNGSAKNATLTEHYPPELEFVRSYITPNAGNDTWSLGDLSGTRTDIITMKIPLSVSSGTTIVNNATLSYYNSTGGYEEINATTSFVVSSIVPSNVSLIKTASKINASPGEQIDYTINITVLKGYANNGTLTETYPENVTFHSASPSPSSGNNIWNIPNLTKNDKYQINITVNVSSSLISDIFLNNTVNLTYYNATGGLKLLSTSAGTNISTTPTVLGIVECAINNDANFTNCSELRFLDNLTQIRAYCSGNKLNVSFNLTNLYDSANFILDSTIDNSSGYFILNNSDVQILDSGNWSLITTCDSANGKKINSSYFYIGFGNITTASLTIPSGNINATQNSLFNITTSVQCEGGECVGITSILDPIMNYSDGRSHIIYSFSEAGGAGPSYCKNYVQGTNFESCTTAADSTNAQTRDGVQVLDPASAFVESLASMNWDWDNYTFMRFVFNFSGVDIGYSPNATLRWAGYTGTCRLGSSGGYEDYELNEGYYLYGRLSNGTYALINSEELGIDTNITDDNITINNLQDYYDHSSETVEFVVEAVYPSGWYGSSGNACGGSSVETDFISLEYAEAPPDYKGVVPMNSGTPFFTVSQNPVYPENQSCLESMLPNETCVQEWAVNASGTNGTYTFFVDYRSPQSGSLRTNKINVTIEESHPAQVAMPANASITKINETAIVINWSASPNAESYRVYYSSSAYSIKTLNLSSISPDVYNASSAGLGYIDSDHLEDSIRYYRISAVKAGLENISSTIIAKQTFRPKTSSSTGNSYHRQTWIGFAINVSLYAEEFLDMIGSSALRISKLERANSTDYSVIIHNKDTSSSNFSLEAGKRYILETNGAFNYTIVGEALVEPVEMQLKGSTGSGNSYHRQNWLMLPYSDKQYYAESLLDEIGAAALRISKLEKTSPTSYSVVVHNKDTSSNNFTIIPGEGYSIEVSQDVNFTPTG